MITTIETNQTKPNLVFKRDAMLQVIGIYKPQKYPSARVIVYRPCLVFYIPQDKDHLEAFISTCWSGEDLFEAVSGEKITLTFES